MGENFPKTTAISYAYFPLVEIPCDSQHITLLLEF